ncbi:MAG TPA: VapC toxin family PIN domain ribonuclease [Desulfobacterales bacterium]|nr:VapC toxin family PIN domain ribonuclease [Desulfobacterales bacterium]
MRTNTALVLDAATAVAWAFEDEANSYADMVLETLIEGQAFTPSIWPLEVGHALLLAERLGRLEQAGTVQFLELLGQLPIFIEAERSERLTAEYLALARTKGLSICQAAYLHLAMRRGLPLATTDAALREAARGVGVPVFGQSAAATG